MTTTKFDRWEVARDVFWRAIDLPSAERLEFLAARCVHDDQLREVVDELLEAEAAAGTFLDAQPEMTLAASTSSDVEAFVGETIGPYKLLRVLGKGGMGVVFEAEQTSPLHRRVAVKVIRRGMDTEDVVARFETERQALALMEHVNIARVFDAGVTAEGRLYFAMEYVSGASLTEHCDRNELTIRTRLELFLQICDGVQHAHQKAILHRDLKPTNVLVSIQDGRAVPKIIDFGVAKATARRLTERSKDTALGVLIGTPAYMSPEQLEMVPDIDTRADVYSLGVMLHELLSGASPFDLEPREEGLSGMLRAIRQREAPPMSTTLGKLPPELADAAAKYRRTDVKTLRARLRGDLDWIGARALERDRTQRYGSPRELAEEIRRHLSNQPVLASPPSMSYRARKFAQRHRVGVSVVATGVFVFLAFTIAMAIQTQRVAYERDRASELAETSDRVTDFLVGLFGVSDPGEARGNSVTAREILDRGTASIDAELDEQPRIRARMLQTMGEVYLGLGLYDEAEHLLKRALEIHRVTGDWDRINTLQLVNELGELYFATGNLSAAEPYLVEALEYRSDLLGDRHRDTLESVSNVGNLLRSKGEYDAAEEYLKQALDGMRDLLGERHEHTLASLASLGYLYQVRGLYAAAEPYYREALDGYRKTLGADHPNTLNTVNNMGLLHYVQGDLAGAEPYYREVLIVRRRVLGDDHQGTLNSIHNMGALLLAKGDITDAEPYCREALQHSQRVLGEEHPLTIAATNTLARMYAEKGDLSAAERHFRGAVQASRLVHGDQHPRTLIFTISLGGVLTSLGKLSEAHDLLASAVEDIRVSLPREHEFTGLALWQYGRALSAMGSYAAAEPALYEAHEILSVLGGLSDHRVVKVTATLVELYERSGDFGRAEEWRTRLVPLGTD